jgi:ABC-type transport system involved in cytochrome c biogenesis permease component
MDGWGMGKYFLSTCYIAITTATYFGGSLMNLIFFPALFPFVWSVDSVAHLYKSSGKQNQPVSLSLCSLQCLSEAIIDEIITQISATVVI